MEETIERFMVRDDYDGLTIIDTDYDIEYYIEYRRNSNTVNELCELLNELNYMKR